MSEIVYVFTNPAMPDLIKIGRTARDSVQQRLNELSSPANMPLPFICLCRAEVNDAAMVEKALHTAFEGDRINAKREFFRTPPNRVIALLKAFALPDTFIQDELNENMDNEDKAALDRAIKENDRRSFFTFSVAGVPIGAELVYTADETKKCKVIEERKVEYDGKPYTLSGLAMKFRLDAGLKTVSVAGPLYFLYDNELLSERRIRLEEEAAAKDL